MVSSRETVSPKPDNKSRRRGRSIQRSHHFMTDLDCAALACVDERSYSCGNNCKASNRGRHSCRISRRASNTKLRRRPCATRTTAHSRHGWSAIEIYRLSIVRARERWSSIKPLVGLTQEREPEVILSAK